MKCLILAAGYATRLYPLTENFPKPLLPVAGKPILDWLLDDLGPSGRIDSFVVISNHKYADHFEKWAIERPERIRVVDDGTMTNETRLGAVRDIAYAMDQLHLSDDLLIIAGDNVLDFSLQPFLEYAASKGTSCIMRYYEPDENRLHKCGVAETDGNDRILSMEEKPAVPKSHWCTPPFYFYLKTDAARIHEAMDDGCGTDAPGSFAVWLSGKVPVHAMKMPGSRYDIGTLDNYRMIQETYHGIQINSQPHS